MKANGLMVGDWVKFPGGTIDKIVDLPYIEGKGICASFAASATLFPFSVDKLEPIPLTPEILEKNGFKPQGCYKFTYTDNYCSIEIICAPDESEDNEIVYTSGVYMAGATFRTTITMEYIHELQHALHLCGIEKEIIL